MLFRRQGQTNLISAMVCSGTSGFARGIKPQRSDGFKGLDDLILHYVDELFLIKAYEVISGIRLHSSGFLNKDMLG